MSPTHKRIFPKLKHKNDKYGNIANVGNLQKNANAFQRTLMLPWRWRSKCS